MRWACNAAVFATELGRQLGAWSSPLARNS